jgi:hypothetical protein
LKYILKSFNTCIQYQYRTKQRQESPMATHSPRSLARINLVDQPPIDDLDAAIVALARQTSMDTYRLLMLVADFDDRFGWARWGFRNCAEWLAYRCDLSISTAREKVRMAHALRLMPKTAAAFEDGRLSYSKARALTRVVEIHNEQQLLDYALRVTAPQVEDRCRELRNANPDSVTGALRAWQRRSLTLVRNETRGVVTISVELPLEQGEWVAQALERAVAAGEAATGIEFAACSDGARDGVRDANDSPSMEGNGWRAQQADALVAIAKGYLSGAGGSADAPAAAANHCQVVVHVDESALHGGAGRADLPIETVKRLACDGSLVTIVEDENGNPLDVGRKRRTVTVALRRALWSRDRGCTFPGCRNKRYVEAHHIRHWASGGATKVENLTLLCSHHHTLLHEGGFSVRREDDGAIRFARGDGRLIPRCGYRLEDMQDEYVADQSSTQVRDQVASYVLAFGTATTSRSHRRMDRAPPPT